MSIDSPKSGDVVGGTVTIQVTWDDANPDKCELYIGGSLVTTWTTTGTVTYSWDTTAYSDGSYTIQAVAYDKAGNSASSSITVTVDNTAPKVDITSPENGSTVGSTFTVVWNASDANKVVRVEVYLDGVLDAVYVEENMTNNHTFSGVSSGWHNVSVVAFDVVGNSGSDTIDVNVVAVSITITSPKNGSYFNVSWVNVSWDASGDIDHFEIYVDGNVINSSVPADARWYNVSGLSEGSHEISVFVVATSGDKVSDNVTVIIDLTPPSLVIVDPSNYSYFNESTVTVYWSGSDDNLDRYFVRLDGGVWVDVGLNTSYTFSGLKEGEHNVSVKALDKAGNTNVSIVFFTVDLTPPTLQITSPENHSYVNSSSVTMSWSGSDSSGIDHYEVRADDGSWIDVGTVTGYTFSLSDGNHSLYVRAFDLAGNVAESFIYVVVDTVPPEVFIISPSNNDYLRGVVAIEINWTDTNPDRCELYINYTDKPVTTFYSIGVNTYEWNTSTTADGTYSIRAVAYDLAGNKAESEIIVVVDNTPPLVSINSPKNGTAVGSTFTVVWDATDSTSYVARVEVYLDGSLVATYVKDENMTNNHTFSGLSPGWYNISIYAYDAVDNVGIDSILVKVVIISISITSPKNGSYFNTNWVNVSWNASGDIDHFEIYVDGSVYDGSVPADVRWYNVSGLSEGSHEISVLAVGSSGENASDNVTVIIDMTPPDLTITSPSNFSYHNSDTVTVYWSGSDENFDHYEVSFDGGSWENVGSSTSYTCKYLKEGWHNISIRALDKAGNSKTCILFFAVDMTPPIIHDMAPGNGSFVGLSSVTLSWNVTDNFEIDHYEVKADDGSWINVGTVTSYTFENLGDGNHTLYLCAFDKAGNSRTGSVTITIDTVSPYVEILSPSNGTIVSGVVTIEVNWTDDYPDRCELYINYTGKPVRVFYEDGLRTYSWNTTNVSDGTYLIRAIAYDLANNTSIFEIYVLVDNSPPEVSIDNPKDGEYVGGVITIQVTWNDVSPDRCELYIDGTLVKTWNTSGTVSWDWDTTGYGDGSHLIRAVAYDQNGASSEESITVTVDNSPPTIIIESPENGSTVGQAFRVVWNASDSVSYVETVYIYLNGTLEATYIYGINITNNHTFRDLKAPATYIVVVEALDVAGNIAMNSTTVHTVPLSVEILSPSDGEHINTTWVYVVWNATGDIDHFEIYLNDSPVDVSIPSDTDSYNITLLDQEATWNITIVAVDTFGNSVSASITIYTDYTIPSLRILSPPDGSYLRGVVNINISWTDRNADKCVLYIGDKEAYSWSEEGNVTFSWNTSEYLDGSYEIVVVAYDKAGNVARYSITVTVDNTPPEVWFVDPDKNGTTIYGPNISVSWNASDNIQLAYFLVRLDNAPWENVGMDISKIWENVTIGNHTVYVRAYDKAGNWNETCVSFSVFYMIGFLEITAENEYTATYSDEFRIGVTIRTPDGDPAPNIPVWFYINTPEGTIDLGQDTTDDQGYAELSIIMELQPGTYNLVIKCGNYSYYSGSTKIATLIVQKEKTELEFLHGVLTTQYTDDVVVSCRLTTDDNEVLGGEKVEFYYIAPTGERVFVGSSYTSDEGIAEIEISFPSVGEYRIVANYTGSPYYEPSYQEQKIVVEEEEIVLVSLTFSKDRIYTGDSVDIELIVAEDDEVIRYVAGASVSVLVDGKILAQGNTDSNGKYTCTWNPRLPGEYNISFIVEKEGYKTLYYSVTKRVMEKKALSYMIIPILAAGVVTMVLVVFLLRKKKRGITEAPIEEIEEYELGEVEEIE